MATGGLEKSSIASFFSFRMPRVNFSAPITFCAARNAVLTTSKYSDFCEISRVASISARSYARQDKQ